MKLKVCGITQLEQLKELNEIGVDYAGIIFFERSERYALNKLMSKDVQKLSLSLKKVGVFVNASEDQIKTQIELYGLDLIQLHGDETPATCRHLSQIVQVMKVFRINKGNEQNIDWMLQPYEEYCDYYLFDTNRKGAYGGTGEKFEWEILQDNKINKHFFLSGGIGVDDADKVNTFSHPFFYCVDVNSRMETTPGIKDMDKIRTFKSLLKK
jgi:phosphoribosylanthranilate isomerase